MNQFYSEFPLPSKADWEAVLTKELKGANPKEKLNYTDELEGISIQSYIHSSENNTIEADPTVYPFVRSGKIENNDWSNGVRIIVDKEEKANQQALNLLMKGADSLVFDITIKSLDTEKLLKGIELQYLKVIFECDSLAVVEQLLPSISSFSGNCFLRLDFEKINFKKALTLLKDCKIPFCSVNAFQIQQIGGSINQELAFGLSLGNEYIVRLLEEGISINEAVTLIHFNFGVGARYFNEVAKLRVFRKLWSFILTQYGCHLDKKFPNLIASEIGFTNKSLKDPYTNLLRQSTEVMSAVISGSDFVLVNPYDRFSNNGSSDFSRRMALNISLILKEESYFDKVIDPMGGSYLIEKIAEKLSKTTWELFQEVDDKGGVMSSEGNSYLLLKVKEIAYKRVTAVKEGKQTLIGVNKYSNPQVETLEWNDLPKYFGREILVLEREVK